MILFYISIIFIICMCQSFSSSFEGEEKKPLVRVLSIDGGGIRGIIPLTILSELEKKTGKPICESFDVITGTSTGGIIALSLSAPAEEGGQPRFTASQLLGQYITRGGEIFGDQHKNSLSFGGMLRPRYSSDGLEELSAELLGSTALSSSLVPVAVTAFDISNDMPVLFESQRAKQDPAENFLMRDVAVGTSSAPTYFPPKHMQSFYGQECCVVDGGVVQNNPSLVGYTLAKELYPSENDILLVSLGTGKVGMSLEAASMQDAGAVSWIKPIMTMGITGVGSLVDDQMRRILSCAKSYDGQGMSERYFRLQPEIPESLGALDKVSPSQVAGLLEIGKMYLAENQNKIENLVEVLAKSRKVVSAC